MTIDCQAGCVYSEGMSKKAIPWQSRIIPEPNSGCWLWEGAVNDGYPEALVGGRRIKVHRAAWEQAYGPIPEDLRVTQSCGVALCCNPAHLVLVPPGLSPTSWQDRLVKQADGCWIFTGSLDSDRYGQIRRSGISVRVHRLAWEEANGPIPEGMSVCHTCDVPACCNPAHLFLGSQQDNVTDMVNKGRFKGRASLNALKTHCPNGHEYTPENTLTYRGMRTCRQCNKERSLARYYAHKVKP